MTSEESPQPPPMFTLIEVESKGKLLWDFFILLVIFYTALEIPLSFVLNYKVEGTIAAIDHFISFLFIIDIALTFITTHRVGNQLITDRKEIARNYFSGFFTIDALSALPIVFIQSLGLPLHSSVRFLRLLRLLRLARLAYFMKRVGKLITSMNPALLRLMLFFFWTSLAGHWLACGWFELGGCDNYKDPFTRYLKSLYYIFTTLGTVGYGDITPQTNAQTFYSMFVMILGTAMYGYVVGSVASLIANLDIAKANHSKKMEEVNAFLKYRRISHPLQVRVRGYYEYLWESRMAYDESSIIDDLPPSLQAELLLFINRGIIEKVPIFVNVGEDFIREIAVALKAVVFSPGDLIVRRGEMGDEMYFINRGIVEVVSDDGADIYATLTEGNFFGEIALLTQEPRNATIRCADYCDLYTL
ncbi:MAG: ion transporter, partial [Planctomycetota bacterium]|nr:ion transporter [Planctomycetota bacterium]